MKRLLILALVPLSLAAQQSTPLQLLKQVAKAAGGEVWLNPKTLMLQGHALWTPDGHKDSGSQLMLNDYAMYRVFPDSSRAAHAPNGMIRFDARHGDSTFLQLIYNGRETHNTLSQRAAPYRAHFSWANNFGFSIIRFAGGEGFLVEQLADDPLDGEDCHVIRITDPSKMVTQYWIDKQKYWIRGMGFQTDIGWHMRVYSDFTSDPQTGFLQPGRLRIYYNGTRWLEIYWTRFSVNGELPLSVFRIPDPQP